MYMPGRLRTASRPLRTLILLESYWLLVGSVIRFTQDESLHAGARKPKSGLSPIIARLGPGLVPRGTNAAGRFVAPSSVEFQCRSTGSVRPLLPALPLPRADARSPTLNIDRPEQ